jgi:hypothetical protein
VTFEEAAELARATADPRETFARQRAQALLPPLSGFVAASGRSSWRTRVTAAENDPVVAVAIPDLDPTPAPRRAAEPERPVALRRGRLAAVVWIAGVGVAGIGVGTAFGIAARSLWQQARPNCDTSNVCTDAAFELAQRGRRDADVSTVAFILGGAALVTGAVLYLRGAAR